MRVVGKSLVLIDNQIKDDSIKFLEESAYHFLKMQNHPKNSRMRSGDFLWIWNKEFESEGIY